VFGVIAQVKKVEVKKVEVKRLNLRRSSLRKLKFRSLKLKDWANRFREYPIFPVDSPLGLP
jgi:hypothetical protein